MNQTTESFQRIETIFHEALIVPVEVRKALIESLSQGDRELAAEVYALLDACKAEEDETELRRANPAEGRDTAAKSRRIGPFEIDRLLGRGGMGAVYLAHRADGQFEQQVAIKLIDLPLATDVFRERFRQERQILAGLQHPYIARLLDGGVAQNGDLYLAMEYVDGVPIHTFCEQKHCTQTQRLTLFIQVCEAVQFAHQNLVVHRDLKPDNILVAEDGTPRLLDFGTAKLLSPAPANPEAQLTREGYQSFTPQYASPEQVLGNPITTASDTYSLGVLLYLLLTDTLPYELKELTTGEMLRAICEEPPRKPTHAAGSKDHLDSDLDAIVLKALRKEPLERYRTAEQLAADVRAFLDGRPVAACRGTVRYRASKFVQRHSLAIAGAAVLVATLLTGIVGVLWQAKVANEQRRMAEARSADLRQLSSSLLSELDEAIKQLPGSTGAQKLLVTRVLEHLDRMAKDAQGDRATQLDLIDAYMRLGNIQGNAYDQNLGDAEGGLVSLGKAQAIAGPLVASDPSNTAATRALALVEQSRSEILWQLGDTPKAVTAMQEAVQSFDKLIADPHASPALIGDAAGAYGNLGDELGQPGTSSLGKTAAALDAYRKTLELHNRALAIDPSFLRARRGLAIVQMKMGSVELASDPEQALKDFQVALDRTNALPNAEQNTLPTVRLRTMILRKEAGTLSELGRYEKAIPLFDQAIQIEQKMVAADPQDSRALFDLQIVLSDKADCLEDASDPSSGYAPDKRRQYLVVAESLRTQILTIMARMLRDDQSNDTWKFVMAGAQVHLGTIKAKLKEPGDSGAMAKAGLAVFRRLASGNQVSPMYLDQAAAAFLDVEPAALKDPGFAVACAEREVTLSQRQRPNYLLTLARAYSANGQTEKSRAAATEALALLPAQKPGSSTPTVHMLLEMKTQK
jgi:eukaryotic-like serine/threonine-protein kinase